MKNKILFFVSLALCLSPLTILADDLSMPENLTVNNIYASSAQLHWDNVADATGYEVELTDKNGELIKIFNTTKNKRKAGKLVSKSNTTYKFRVRAVNGATYSSWSDYYTYTTKPARPQKPRIRKKQADQFVYRWNKPKGTITQYEVQLLENGEIISSYSVVNDTKKIIKDLVVNSPYQIRVRAYNGDLWSKWTAKKNVRTDTVNYFMKIRDLTTEHLDVKTPGADIDSIRIIQDDNSYHYANELVRYRIINGGVDNTNFNYHADEALGASDLGFVSLGGVGGYLVVKFPCAVNSNIKSVTIRELGSTNSGGYSRGIDEEVRVFIGKTSHGPWIAMGKGSGEFTLDF
ncbi:MAG: fibronectin type III domain-containing protein [Patescibacteria group bacterium]